MLITVFMYLMAAGPAAPHVAAARKPNALVTVEQSRKNIRTADIEWSVRYNFPTSKSEVFFRSRIAGNDTLLVHKGDANGVVRYDSEGNPAVVGLERGLERDGDSWEYLTGTLTARYWPDRPRQYAIDIRAAGLLPKFFDTRFRDALWAYPSDHPPRSYSTKAEGNVHIVTADLGDRRSIIWHIDRGRGWNPVRVTLTREGKVVRKSISTLKKFGGTWFPSKVEYYTHSLVEPIQIITVRSASFNRPDHPRRFTPNDIGLEPGVVVEVQKTGAEAMVWDGEKCVPTMAFYEDVKAGRKKVGPNMARLHEEMRAGMRTDHRGVDPAAPMQGREVREVETEWERYVREFIRKHGLSKAQRASARAILKDCVRQAQRYVIGHAAEFTDIEVRVARLAREPGKDARKERRAIGRARAKLMEPIDRIFAEQLKPRLEELLSTDRRRGTASRRVLDRESPSRSHLPWESLPMSLRRVQAASAAL